MLKTSITVILIFNVSFSITAQKNTFCEQIELVNNHIEQHHISPKPIGDSLSAQVWDNFISALDPNKRYLLQSDLDKFEKDRYALDDYFNEHRCRFIKTYVKQLKKRLDGTREILESFYDKEFNYNPTDSLYFDANRGRGLYEDKLDKTNNWLRAMKYETVTEAVKRYDDKESFLAAFDSIKPEVKRFVLNRAVCTVDKIKKHQNGFEAYVQEVFLNALSTVHDPHSMYFSNAEKNAFDSAYSSNSLSFGISTDKNEKGQIIIYNVNPNSPAALNNKIEAGDVLRALKANKKTLLTTCISNQEVINFLNDKNHNTIEFEIEKPRGQIKTILLTKTNVPVEFNTVDALIVDEDIKAGYVNIPSFYVNHESTDWRGTSLDVGKALYKLLQDDIEGLLIDLRLNSGGSMKEAIDSANLFIDGPMAILKQTDDMLTVFNDQKAALFNKPIVIMVDANTASAAELFAGVMQDYKKAVIAGNATYGKATSQNILPLKPDDESLGFLKLTSEKFYRISGESHQVKGIQPDIAISTIFKDITDRETDYIYALKSDTLKVSEQVKTFKLPLKKLKKLSMTRQNTSEIFKAIKTTNNTLKYYVLEKEEAYPFTPEYIYKDMKQFNVVFENISAYVENKQFLKVELTSYDKTHLQSQHAKRLETITTYISGDPTVFESYRILKDFIEIKNAGNTP